MSDDLDCNFVVMFLKLHFITHSNEPYIEVKFNILINVGCNLCPFVLRSLSGGKYTKRGIILYNSIVMCTKEIHQKLIQEEDTVTCIFFPKAIQDPGRPKRFETD